MTTPAEQPNDPTPNEAPAAAPVDGAPDGAAPGSEQGAPEGGNPPAEGQEPPAAPAEPAAEPVAADAPFEGLTPPEGFAALDAEALTAATPLLRGLGVTDTAGAQKAINDFAPIFEGMVTRASTAAAEKAEQDRAALVQQWEAEVKADPEIGGANYDKTVALSAKVLDKFFTEEDRAFLTASGLGNNPGLVRAFAKMGAAISDGPIHVGGAAAPSKGHVLYDDAFLPPEQRRG